MFMLLRMKPRVDVQGRVAPGFDRVREVFAGNFATRGELGGACCAYHRHGRPTAPASFGLGCRRMNSPSM